MNSAFIWILFPVIVAGVLLIIIRWRTLSSIVAAVAALILAALAAWLPAQEQIVIWRWVIPFSESFLFFGRQLELTAADRPTLVVLYFTVALWFVGVPLARPTRLFLPLGMAIVALFAAAIAVEPFLFAAVLILIAVLLSIPLVSFPGKAAGRGVLRYLTFQTLGMPFVLISGFFFTGFEGGPGDPVIAAIAIALLAIGFALLLGVFPFHTWIPMLAEDSHPYPAVFIFLLLPIAVLLFGLGFLDNYVWIREDPNTLLLLQLIGALMVVIAGVWAAVEGNLSRMLGFAVLLDIGYSLLAISLAIGTDPVNYRLIFLSGLLPRGISLGILALAMSSLNRRVSSFGIYDLRGLGKIFPGTSTSIIIALFCLAGLPLLAGFPFKLGIIEGISSQAPVISIWVILGSFGLIIGTIRLLISMVSSENVSDDRKPESRLLIVFLLVGVGLLFLIGLFPNIFLQLISKFPGAFTSLG